jgi:transposase
VRIHFTPTYSSWLNQVELWFAKIERDLLRAGHLYVRADLAAQIRRYIRHYNKAANRSAGVIGTGASN